MAKKRKKSISTTAMCDIVHGAKQLIRTGIAEGAYDDIVSPAWPKRFLKELDSFEKKHCKTGR